MSITPISLRTNALAVPLGIDTRPEFSWRLHSEWRGASQVAYHLQLTDSPEYTAAATLLWDSGEVPSRQPFGVLYQGRPLASSTRYCWRVSILGSDGVKGPWSESAWFETGKLDPQDWHAKWIGGAEAPADAPGPVLYLRRDLELTHAVLRARAYVSALGWYRFFVNGRDLTDRSLVPRWTPFDHIVEYQTYDITHMLRPGTNRLAMAVADGRFRGFLGSMDRHGIYGDRVAGFAQIELECADGSRQVLVTDPSWQAGTGRILASDPRNGERVDLRISDDPWLSGRPSPAHFRAATILPAHTRQLVAEDAGRVGPVASLPPLSIRRTPAGRQLVDFGQNFAGIVRIRLRGAAGQVVRLTHGERVRKDGELDDFVAISRKKAWFQRDEVTLGDHPVWYEPWFSIRGFRYLEVDGNVDALTPADVEAVVLSAQLHRAGGFECSNPLLNRLHRNVSWSLRSNFTDTPTDCPQRERSGWTGDVQVFSPTATMFNDAQAYLRGYLRNLALEQLPDGRVPNWIPSEASAFSGGQPLPSRVASSATGWGDASVILPWNLFWYYGDELVLAHQYESMRRWVGYLEREAAAKRGRGRWFSKRLGSLDRRIIGSGFHWGEWLRPGETTKDIIKAWLIPSAVVATAYFARSAYLLSNIAERLGKADDARHYAQLWTEVRQAWRAAFLHSDGRIGDDKQDDYVRALAFELLEPSERDRAVARLVALIEEAGNHVGTGFLSTAMLLPVLAEHGRLDVAYQLLLQTTPPSWLYAVEQGATTIWESWQGYREGQPTNSENHYALGSVAAWLYQGVAGLAPLEPGYRRILIRPLIGGGLSHASAWIDTPFGRACSAWRVEAGRVHLEVVIPTGASARVHHGEQTTEIGSGEYRFDWPTGAQPLGCPAGMRP